ncbi:TPA: ead/Ea22-like family protein [Escherichia coli]|nr:ead/Ea22-like family protein [Escherichia coli]HAX4021877.1 ead/Ea22-like family protein [Escherichia coli]
MSKINYQVLRMAAENATPGEWCSDDYYGVIADAGLNANYYIASCSGPDNRANKRFIAAANPATVLALLDELEAKDKRIADMEAREVVLPRAHDVHPLGPQSAKIFCEFHRSIVNRCADEIRKVGVKVSIKGN